MVNLSAAVAAPTAVYEVAYPTDADTVPALTRWLNAALDRVEDGAAPGGLMITLTGTTPTVGCADVATWTRWEKAVSRLERLPVPTVAAVDGAVQGPAFGMLLAVDLVVASPQTVLCCRDLDEGRLPGMALYRLAKHTGLGQARRIVLTRQQLPAAEALRGGLVTAVSAAPRPAARTLLDRHFTPGDPNWYLTRRLLVEGYSHNLEDALGGVLAAQERALREHAG